MWEREFRDYPNDSPMRREKLDLDGKSGCEMNERFGWGITRHKRPKVSGTVAALFSLLFGFKRSKK